MLLRSLSVSVCWVLLSCLIVGCSLDTTEQEDSNDDRRYLVEIRNGESQIRVLEDEKFGSFLNAPTASSTPAPSTWHSIPRITEAQTRIRIENCAHLDLLDIIVYPAVSPEGIPTRYEYLTVCGPEAGRDCSLSQEIPPVVVGAISSMSFQRFAVSGICISEDGVEAVSFISFLKEKA